MCIRDRCYTFLFFYVHRLISDMLATEQVNIHEKPRESSQEKLKVTFEKPGRKRKQKSILSGIEPKRLKMETPHVVLKPSRLKPTSEPPVLPSGQFKQVINHLTSWTNNTVLQITGYNKVWLCMHAYLCGVVCVCVCVCVLSLIHI